MLWEIVLIVSALLLFLYFVFFEAKNDSFSFADFIGLLAIIGVIMSSIVMVVYFIQWIFCPSEETFCKTAEEKLIKIEYTEQILIEKAKEEFDILLPSHEYEIIKDDYLDKVRSYNAYVDTLKKSHEAKGFQGWLFRNKTFIEDYELVTPITS